MSLSIHSRERGGGDFYGKINTKLCSNKEKAHIALIWVIILHYYKVKLLFSIH